MTRNCQIASMLLLCILAVPGTLAAEEGKGRPDGQLRPLLVPVVTPNDPKPRDGTKVDFKSIGSSLFSLGGGIYVEGIASFLAERAEGELTSWVIDVLLRKVCDLDDKKKNIVGKKWFPETCTLIGDPAGIGLQINGPLLVSAMRHDMEKLPWLVLAHMLKDKADDVPLAGRALAGFVRQTIHGDPPLGLLAGLGEIEELKDRCKAQDTGRVNLACMLAVVGSVSKHLAGVCSNVSSADRPAWLNNSALMKDVIEGNLAALKTDIESFCTSSSALCNGVKSTIGKAIDSADSPEFGTIASFVRAVAYLQMRLEGAEYQIGKEGDWRQVTKQVLALVADVVEAGSAIDPSTANNEHVKSFIKGLRGFGDIIAGDYSRGVGEVLSVIVKCWDQKDAIPPEIRRMLSLATDLALADTRDDVKAALDAAAEPIGGWRLKRRQTFTLSITGLVGGQAGGETICSGALCVDGDEAGWAAGLFAALGIDMAWSIEGSWTLGPFVSILDLGQLTWVRLSDRMQGDRELDTAPEVGFAQVFSPGVYLRAGVGDTPFTFGLGASYAPALRGYEWRSETPEPVDQMSGDQWCLRFGIFLAVDVTIFNLW